MVSDSRLMADLASQALLVEHTKFFPSLAQSTPMLRRVMNFQPSRNAPEFGWLAHVIERAERHGATKVSILLHLEDYAEQVSDYLTLCHHVL